MIDIQETDIVFIASYFDMSYTEAVTWLSTHSQEYVNDIFNEYIQ